MSQNANKNNLGELNAYLFDMMRTIGDSGLSGKELDEEIKRAHAITNVATQIVKTNTLQLRAIEFQVNHGKENGISAKKLLNMSDFGNGKD